MTSQDEPATLRVAWESGAIHQTPYASVTDAHRDAAVLCLYPGVESVEVITVDEKRDQLADALNTLATSIEKLCETIEQRLPQQPAEIEYREISEEWKRKHASHLNTYGPAEYSDDEVSGDLRQCGAPKPNSDLRCRRSAGHRYGHHLAYGKDDNWHRW